ncbi:phosphate ABC transporter permease PstA [Pseudemcibacter aquimaris]|uniref:phosphate ABC transporter permease PstA n=1 Tax=Pseudemcibacter aquimaris TaxID=2857064 RepID=UPI002010DD41|nr:phosphate ABC transporter permease PstA [Pseudemcibacter aquimaris]MCC3860219.1 phosphate ABC transporter permease PstA [Pseudemcibacter aquimaris]WDU57544.1 phosphate ABC transporter permease PstA [Pseudemcibacter aquimaris]
MTDTPETEQHIAKKKHKAKVDWNSQEQLDRLASRYRKEKLFKTLAICSLGTAIGALLVVLISIFITGFSGFTETRITMNINMDEAVIGDISAMNDEERSAHVAGINANRMLISALQEKFPDVTSRRDTFAMLRLFSVGAQTDIRDAILVDPSIIGQTVSIDLKAGSDVDMFLKGKISRDVEESDRKISDMQIAWVDQFSEEGSIKQGFNWGFFTSGDSREPELAGIWSATVGSFLTLMVTFFISFPIGVGSAIYLEEFAPKNRLTDLIEININNLAAVPSIIFGLLGLAIFINIMELPRSAPLVGGLTLALMTLPTIIITARAAIKAVPPSIKEAAIGLGASHMQTVFHHVLPLSMPGILTGAIIGMAQALGETAPLLMIGMVAFIVDTPSGISEAATALPVQVYLWADSPERGFLEKTSAAIMVLLLFLIIMNGLAIWLRQKFEKKW